MPGCDAAVDLVGAAEEARVGGMVMGEGGPGDELSL